MSSNRLPGDLDIRQARWMLTRHAGLLGRQPHPGHLSGVPVTRRTRPELFDTVAETAGRLGTAMPDRVLLTGTPTVDLAVAHRRRHLLIGLPLLDCLSATELRALVGHRLALLRHRHCALVVGLLHLWTEAVRAETYEQGRDLRRVTEFRRTLAGFAAEVQHDADEAAVLAAGADAAARAFALADAVAEGYADFLDGTALPEHRWWRPVEVGISDVSDGWRHLLRHGTLDVEWGEDEAQVLATLHPRLADALRALGRTPPPVVPTARPVPVAPLSGRERRRLVRRLLNIPYPRYIRWYTFADSPPRWWLRRAAQEAGSVRADVAAVLGRPPVDDVEAIEVIRTRPREVLAAAMHVPVSELSDDPGDCEWDEPPAATIWLVEENLLRRGWRLAHPAVRGVLIGPAGERVDARAVIAGADQAYLRRLLTSG
ncbi:hypothetical protein [Verrucosispora sp. NA02020]|uniref:hypothetical protein n=1 Tax=Verrucosispora sp. NA02020 TaxID=2742132 RepID=UPI00159235B3|nr:hypothetical protein [Verrucosispora sp. NA02020]QKW11367.1 hypothetical protein HUT12_00245 [Verrucosispora sp. NA02020]